MKSGESVTDYFSRMMAIINKMRIHGDKTEYVSIIDNILPSMTSKFNFVVCSIEESMNTDELSIDELQSSLLIEEKDVVETEAEDIMTAYSNKNMKIIRFMILKGEEEVEAITIPPVTDRRHQFLIEAVIFLLSVLKKKLIFESSIKNLSLRVQFRGFQFS
ncbi:hypothetical protein ACOSP7_031137 [Xanthoceras sorbifolium]